MMLEVEVRGKRRGVRARSYRYRDYNVGLEPMFALEMRCPRGGCIIRCLIQSL
jgi:hypothetical protein